MKSKLLYCYFGHHKAATTYIDQSILQAVCTNLGLNKLTVYSPKVIDYDFNKFINDQNLDFLSYINADNEYVESINKPFKGFHVIRDPRDIIVSAYYSHLKSHPTDVWPELIEHRKKLQRLSKEDGLLQEIKFSKQLITDGVPLHPLDSISKWDYNRNNILELRFEDMVSGNHKFFVDIFEFLGLLKPGYVVLANRVINKLAVSEKNLHHGISKSNLQKILEDNSFSNLSGGRDKGKEDKSSHYRKGSPGDWRNHFSEKIKGEFKKTYPNLVSKLGYESDENW